MRQRCHNPNHPNYNSYGARGITVCDRWRYDFAAFYADMGDCPDGLTLERIDNSKGYSPDNCKWASYAEQNRNHRLNHYATLNGRRMCLADWAKELGLNSATVSGRIHRGWTPERALTTPVNH